MIQIAREIEVGRPPDEVFERITKIEDLPRWQPAIVEAEVTSDGPLDLGSTLRLVVAAGGRRTEAIDRVTEFQRPERLAVEASAGPADLAARITVGGADGGRSIVGLETAIRLGGFLSFAEGMIRGRIEAEAPAAADAVKEWLEGE